MWDVVVVGAGPAGTAAALRTLQLRPDARVLLIDRATFPRDKPCGDGIAPHVLDVLGQLGVAGVVDGYPPVRRFRLRSGTKREVARAMRRTAYVVPRLVFDERLVAAAVARGAVLERRAVRHIQQAPGGAVLDGEIAARAVVAADGANSTIRRGIGIPPNGGSHTALAIRGYAPALPGVSEQLITMSGESWPAYAWAFPIGDGTANVGYGEVLFDQPSSRGRLLERMKTLLPEASDPDRLRAHLLPLSSQRPRQPGGRVLLAGDALSLINPFTGEGIYYAVHSGMLAGQAALDRDNPGASYRRMLARSLGGHLRATSVARRLGGSPAVVDASVLAAESDQRIFDDLVELGLGRGNLTPALLAGLARTLPGSLRRHGQAV